MDLLAQLNNDFNIKIENNVAYFNEGGIAAKTKKELINFYIQAFEYKYSMTIEGENDTRKRYKKIIDKLKKIQREV